jgi:hypothetical protein
MAGGVTSPGRKSVLNNPAMSAVVESGVECEI